MKDNQQIRATVVERIAKMARETAGREELRSLLDKVAGDAEFTLKPLGENESHIDFDLSGLGDTSEYVVKRATTAEERENWLDLLAKLDTTYYGLPPEFFDKHRSASDVKTAKSNSQKKKRDDTDLVFVIVEAASLIVSLLKITGEKENLPFDSSVVVRMSGLLVRHLDFIKDGTRTEAEKSKQSGGKLAPLASDGLLRSPADRITQSAIEAFMPGAIKKGTERDEILERAGGRGLSESFFAVYSIESKNKDFYGVGGFREELGDALWDTLQNRGELAIRAQFALWARVFQETNAETGKFVRMTINQFCDDIGFSRNKGAHKRENKQSAIKILQLLTSFEVSIMWKNPAGKLVRVRGPIWQRGPVGEELDQYSDLFGANRIGNPDAWEPVAFAYAPGYFFENEDWRKYNKAVALIGKGLLELSAQERDRWAVLVGGYIALQARFGDYRPKRFKVSTLLEKTRLIEQSKNRNTSRAIDKLETALDKLKQVHVIAGWRYTSEPEDAGIDYDDLETAETRQQMARESSARRLTRAELEKVIEIEWTDLLANQSKFKDEKLSKVLRPKGKTPKTA